MHYASRFIFPEINRQMTDYLSRTLNLDVNQASQLRTDYWLRYGATLLGMMKHHNTDPHHFLHHTHQFPNLAEFCSRPGVVPQKLKQLDGLRILLTNAPRAYAVDLLKILGLYQHLDGVVAIEDMVIHSKWRPKPSQWLWPALQKGLRCRKLVLVDDTLGHLHKASKHGIEGVWITYPEIGFKARLRTGSVKYRIKHLNQLVKGNH